MYYCVKENLCEVLFKSVSIQPLSIFEKGAGKIVYPPPHHHLLSFPRLFNSELLGCLPHSKYTEEFRMWMCRNQNERKKHDWQICYRYRIIISLSLCQTSMNWNGMYTSLSGCRSSGPILFCNYLFELKDWTFYM